MNWVTIEDAIQAWVVAGTGLAAGQVIWANQDEEAPTGTYVALRAVARPMSRGWITYTDDLAGDPGEELIETHRQQLELEVQLQVFGGSATGVSRGQALIQGCRSRAMFSVQQELFNTAGWAPARWDPAQDVSASTGSIFEPRTVVTCYGYAVTEVASTATYIEFVELRTGLKEQVYILMGHSIIVGAANLANVGPEYDYLDIEMPNLFYAELKSCPEDDGVGVCAIDTGWGVLDGSGSFGPELSLAYAITQAERKPIRIINCSTSGTDWIRDWAPDAATGYVMYSRAKAYIDTRLAEIALDYEIVGFLLGDGVNDSSTTADSEAMEASYQAVLDQLAIDYPDVPVTVSRVNSDSVVNATRLAAVRAGTDALKGVAIVDMDGISLKVDGIHPDTLGQIDYGERIAAKMIPADTQSQAIPLPASVNSFTLDLINEEVS